MSDIHFGRQGLPKWDRCVNERFARLSSVRAHRQRRSAHGPLIGCHTCAPCIKGSPIWHLDHSDIGRPFLYKRWSLHRPCFSSPSHSLSSSPLAILFTIMHPPSPAKPTQHRTNAAGSLYPPGSFGSWAPAPMREPPRSVCQSDSYSASCTDMHI